MKKSAFCEAKADATAYRQSRLLVVATDVLGIILRCRETPGETGCDAVVQNTADRRQRCAGDCRVPASGLDANGMIQFTGSLICNKAYPFLQLRGDALEKLHVAPLIRERRLVFCVNGPLRWGSGNGLVKELVMRSLGLINAM